MSNSTFNNSSFDFRASFDEIYPKEVLDDFQRIYEMLTPEVINHHMMQLEKEVEKKLKEKRKLVENEEDEETEIPKKPGKRYTSHYHVLTEIMIEWGQQNGFNLPNKIYCIEKNESGIPGRSLIDLPGSPPVIFGLLTPQLFISLILGLGFNPKDIGAGVSHGEFTHFLQLYIIIEQNKKEPFLHHPVNDLIKIMGDFTDILGKTPWEIIFDRNPGTGSYSDPDYFNAKMTNTRTTNIFKQSEIRGLDIEDYPLLSQLLKGRADKRESNYRFNPNNFFVAYLAEETKEKYNKKNGLVIDSAVYFPTNDHSNRQVVYDDITHEIESLKSILPQDTTVTLPEIDENQDLIDQLIQIFDLNQNSEIDAEVKGSLATRFGQIKQALQDLKDGLNTPNAVLRHRDILSILTSDVMKLDSYGEGKNYLASALRYAVEVLEDFNPKLDNANITTFTPG